MFDRLRAIGSAALNMCSVASGGADCYFEFGIHAWDIGKTVKLLIQTVELTTDLILFTLAAGALIVTEAGGVCLDTEGV